MTLTLSSDLTQRLGDFVAERMGLSFPAERAADLLRGIQSGAAEFGFSAVEECVEWLLSSPLSTRQLEILASHLTIGETYFFREQRSFEALEKTVLPELIAARREGERRLRIWSAGCCTGEEPYSLAILLHRLIPDLDQWNVTILATDINPRFRQRAELGRYKPWSFRDTPAWVKERYFTEAPPGLFEIHPRVREMVQFAYVNLADDTYPSLTNQTNAMDLILCRNVLMYFVPERARKVVQNLRRSLTEGGWLLVSPSETSPLMGEEFAAVTIAGAVFYRKSPPDVPGEAPAFCWEKYIPASAPAFRGEETVLLSGGSFPAVSEESPVEVPAPSTAAQPDRSFYQTALGLYEQGQYGPAAEFAAQAVARDVADSAAMNLLGRALANQGKLAEAQAWCDRALAADKLNTGLHYLRATILEEQGQLTEAAAGLKRVLYLDPHFALAHVALGHLALRRRQTEDARKHFKHARTLLGRLAPSHVLPESDGLTAGRLAEVIDSTTLKSPRP